MRKIVVFNRNNAIEKNVILGFLYPKAKYVVNCDTKKLERAPKYFWKQCGNTVEEMSRPEKLIRREMIKINGLDTKDPTRVLDYLEVMLLLSIVIVGVTGGLHWLM